MQRSLMIVQVFLYFYSTSIITVVASKSYDGMYATIPTSNRVLREHRQTTSINLTMPSIIDGQEATKGEFPWFGQTAITFSYGYTSTCGGSLIHSDIVMTAAHCIEDSVNSGYSIAYYLGAINIDGSDGETLYVEQAIWPSNYNFPINDIAFYKLTTFTNVVPVQWNTDSSIPNVGDLGTAIGFGYVDNNQGEPTSLMKVDLPAISNTQCNEPISITCTQTPTSDKDVCQGDSGGPILTPDGIVYGITSFTSGTTCGPEPSGFTRTSYYNDLIEKVICTYSNDRPAYCSGVGELQPNEVIVTQANGDRPSPSPTEDSCNAFFLICFLLRILSFFFGY